MKIFLNDPNGAINTLITSGHINESYDSFITYNDIRELMNDILLERPRLIITTDRDLTQNHIKRIIDICTLHEIPIIFLVGDENNIEEIYSDITSILLFVCKENDQDEFVRQFGQIKTKI